MREVEEPRAVAMALGELDRAVREITDVLVALVLGARSGRRHLIETIGYACVRLQSAVIAIGGVLLMFILKQLFNRARPLMPLLEPVQGLSFPSGHALMSMSFYGLLIFLVWENVSNQVSKWILSILLFTFILLIGFSRIYLRLHYFSDVIAGFAAGIIWLSLSIWMIRRIERFSRKEIDPVVTEGQPSNTATS